MKAKALGLKGRCFHWEQASSQEAAHPTKSQISNGWNCVWIRHKTTKPLRPSGTNQVCTTHQTQAFQDSPNLRIPHAGPGLFPRTWSPCLEFTCNKMDGHSQHRAMATTQLFLCANTFHGKLRGQANISLLPLQVLWSSLNYCLLQTRVTSRNLDNNPSHCTTLPHQVCAAPASSLNLLPPSHNICSPNAYKC